MNITGQKQIHRYREKTSGYQQREGEEEARQGYGVKRYKLLCIK